LSLGYELLHRITEFGNPAAPCVRARTVSTTSWYSVTMWPASCSPWSARDHGAV